jgi:hypothetical protein
MLQLQRFLALAAVLLFALTGRAATTDLAGNAMQTAGLTPSSTWETYIISLPTVTALSLTELNSVGGSTVTLTGTGFANVTAVKFGSTAATSFTVNSATSIIAVAPAGTVGATGNVTVTTQAGTSATGTGNAFSYGGSAVFVTNTSTTSGIAGSALGQSFTMPGTIGDVSANRILTGFNFLNTSSAPSGAGTAYLLDGAYAGTSAGLASLTGSSTPKKIAAGAWNGSNRYVFPNVTLEAGVKYYIYTDSVVPAAYNVNGDPLAGGEFYYTVGDTFFVLPAGDAAFQVWTAAATPTVTTASASSLAATSVTLGGNVTADGGDSVTERGIVYSTSNTTPTTSDTKVAIGSGRGAFSQSVTGLTASTTYYVRAFATNSVSTSYGSAITVTTPSNNANLAGLVLSSGTLNPVFAAGTTSYTSTVDSSTSSLTVTPTVADGNATVKVNGTLVTSGSASGSLSLNAGDNPITVLVTAPDGSTTKTYTVTVTRPASADVAVTMTASPTGGVEPGSNITYTITVFNFGPDSASNVSLSDVLPPGLTFVSLNSPTGWTAVVANGTVNASTSSLSSGTSAVFTVVANVGSGVSVGTMLTNTATAASSTQDLNSPNDAASASCAIVDLTPPTLTSVTIASNNANPARAKVGNNITLTFTASETIATPTVSIAGHSFTATNSSGNTWSAAYQMASGDTEGVVPFSIAFADTAGNNATVTTTTNGSSVTFDKTAPTITAANITISGATGTGGAYKIGDVLTIRWDNSASGNNNSDVASVRVSVINFGGTIINATETSGIWTANYTIAAGSIDATNRNVTVSATDTTGNSTNPFVAGNANATIDNIAPTVTAAKISLTGATGAGGVFKIGDTITATWDNSASGDNNSDTLTAVTVNFSAFGGGSAVSANNSGGIWTATYQISAGTLEASNLNVVVSATDNAGNITQRTDDANASIDNLAPSAPSTPDLAAASDSGTDTDNITNVTTPTFTGTAAAGTTVKLYDGSTEIGSTTATGGIWSINASTLAAGTHSITAKASDAAGNLSVASSALSVTIDATAPTIAINAISTDDRLSGSEAASSLTISGTTSGAEDGRTVTVTLNGQSYTSAVTSNTWSVTVGSSAVGALAEQAHTVAANVSDTAGNAATQATRTLTVDKTAPTIAIDAISTDNRLNAAEAQSALTISGTTNAEDGRIVTVTLNSASYTGTVASRAWSVTIGTTPLGALSDRAYTVTADVSDLAGNAATQAARTLTVDKTAPNAPVITGISDDTGNSATDNITKDTTLFINGTAEPGSTVTLTRVGNSLLGTVTADATTGAWSYDYTGTTLAAGDHSFTATATDAAGNVSAVSNSLIVTVDTATAAPVITAFSDNSGATSDAVTNYNTLILSGTAEPGSTITLTRSGFAGSIGTATANSTGAWTFDYTATTLADGSYIFNASTVDVAGNASATSADFPVIIDTVAPTITSATIASGTYRSGFSFTIVAATAVNFSSTTLPAGLSLDAATGVISGTPTTSGTFNVTLTVTDLAGNSATGTLTITLAKIPLTVSGLAVTAKIYDGTSAAVITGTPALDGVVGADAGAVTLAGTPLGAFANADVGANKPVAISGLSLTGSAAANYQLTAPTATASISAKPITVNGVSAANKAYDGTTAATLVYSSPSFVGVVQGDDVTLVTTGATARFDSAISGANKPVTITGLTLGGAQAANYALTQPATTASITAKNLTVSGITANAKTYDASLVASLNVGSAALVGVVDADNVTLVTSGAAGAFTSKAIGTAKPVVITGLTLTGADAGNYSLTQPSATASITAKILTVSGVAAIDRVYDATIVAALNFGSAALVGVAGTDNVTLVTSGAAGAFATKTVGAAKAVTVTGLALGGTDAANYSLTQPSSTATITAKSLTVTGATAASKTYDGTATASLNFGSAALVGVISPDTVTLVSSGATGAFASASPGTGKVVSVSGLSLGGADSANYTLVAPTLTADIAKGTASIAFANLSQTYTGSPRSVSASTTPSGLNLTITYNGSPTAPTDAGTYSVSGSVVDTNYAGSGSATLTIAKASQSVTFAAASSVSIGAPIALSASASTGLPVTFSLVSGNATLAGSTLTLNDAGPIVVRATQAGNANYSSASADQTFSANKLAQTISFAALSNKRATDAPFALSASASSGLPVSFTLVNGPAAISGSTLTLTGQSGAVTVRASQAGNNTYDAAPDVTQSFNVLGSDAHQVFFGLTQNNDTFAVDIAPDGKSGTLLCLVGATGEAFIVTFTLNADGTFDATVTPASAGPQVSPLAEDGRPVARAAVARTFRGRLSGGVLTGSIVELGLNFSANVQPPSGPTANIAGFYQAASTNTASGSAYSIVGTQGQVYVLAVTPSVTSAGTGAIKADNSFAIQGAQNATISGTIDQVTTTVSGSIVVDGKTTDRFVGAVARTDRLVDLASRARLTPNGSGPLITGFVIGGTGSKRVLVRAVGPALSGFGVQGALADPKLRLFNAAGAMLAENDNWTGSDTAATFTQVGAFGLSDGSKDAALVTTLEPGAYTVHVMDGGGTGVVLAEVYDASTNPGTEAQHLVNISTRGIVTAGEGALIGGFVITGNAPKRVLIRGVGPGLTAFNVPGALADPVLKIYDANSSVIAQNDNWGTPQAVTATQVAATSTEIAAAGTATGAFALAAGSRDAAVVITLAPGAYTAEVAGAAGSTGAALVEIFEFP